MVPKAETTLARFVLFASASAPDDVCAITRAVSFAFIGSEQVISTFPEMFAGLFQPVVDARPVDRQEQHVGIFGGLARRAGHGAAAGLTSEPVQLPLTARVAKDDVVPGFREDRAELSAHQT